MLEGNPAQTSSSASNVLNGICAYWSNQISKASTSHSSYRPGFWLRPGGGRSQWASGSKKSKRGMLNLSKYSNNSAALVDGSTTAMTPAKTDGYFARRESACSVCSKLERPLCVNRCLSFADLGPSRLSEIRVLPRYCGHF